MRHRIYPQTVSWYRDRATDGTLDVKPPFQRRPVWTLRQKCALVETVLLGLPIPEIFLQVETNPEGSTTHSVVDGQQRIRAILQFVGVESDSGQQEFRNFSLEHVDPTSPYHNRRFDSLSSAEKTRFWSYEISARRLDETTDAEIRDVFARFNRYTVPLTGQEVRNATYVGPFAKLADELAGDDYWAVNKIVSPAVIRRMNDIKLVAEFLIGVMHGPQGGSEDILDDYYRQYEEFTTEFPRQAEVRRRFQRTRDLIESLFPDLKDTRWNNQSDYYSLFVAVAQALPSGRLSEPQLASLGSQLNALASEIDAARQASTPEELQNVPQRGRDYLNAVRGGSNDKARRAVRHRILTVLINSELETQN